MENSEDIIYDLAAGGNASARSFLNLWHSYCHAIDDLIDDKVRDLEQFVSLLAQANVLYSHPFYRRNCPILCAVVHQVTHAYLDSIEMVGVEPKLDWREQWGDTLRLAGNDMVTAVADITGGWETVRKLQPLLREWAWSCHHDEKGKPI